MKYAVFSFEGKFKGSWSSQFECSEALGISQPAIAKAISKRKGKAYIPDRNNSGRKVIVTIIKQVRV